MSCSSPAARTSEVTDHLIVVLKITLVVFIASSLLDMGLRLDPPDAARGLRNAGWQWCRGLAPFPSGLMPIGPSD